MSDTLVSDQPLLPEQRKVFDVLVDQIIPEDKDRHKPSAKEVDVLGFITEHDNELVHAIKGQLDDLNKRAKEQFNKPISEISPAQQSQVIDQARQANAQFYTRLALHTATSYYQDPRVMAVIGVPARAPYPEGFTVQQGDTSLLDPVRSRGTRWRPTS